MARATTRASGTGVSRRVGLLTRRDKLLLALMVGIPAAWHVFFVWLPTVASVGLSFTRWDGITEIDPVGLQNYRDIWSIYPPFKPALAHNLIWLVFFGLVATPMGILLAVLLDKRVRLSRIYQSIFYLPVLLSLAVVGFIWQLIYAPEEGLINNLIGRTGQGEVINWLGNPRINIWAVLVAASWRHIGYVMVLYLAGLKAFDPELRDASVMDGANEWQTFTHVVFPVLKPINIIVLVITVIEALRAFDIVYVINKGTSGLELLSVLVTNNIIGEARRIGFGSALAVILLVISLGFIVTYLVQTFRREAIER